MMKFMENGNFAAFTFYDCFRCNWIFLENIWIVLNDKTESTFTFFLVIVETMKIYKYRDNQIRAIKNLVTRKNGLISSNVHE